MASSFSARVGKLPLVLYVILFSTNGRAKHGFRHHPELLNTVCPPQDIVFTLTLQSRVHCSVVCSQTNTCRNFMFNDNSKDCVICRGRYFEYQEPTAASGYRYYSDLTRNYHLGCTSTSECNEMNNICEELLQSCVCTPGYSFQPATMTCVDGCETYGDTFETYKQWNMGGYNDATEYGVSLEWSVNFCVNAGFLCRSFEREGNTSWFSSANPLTHPSGWMYYDGGESYFYNRNCA